MAQGIDWLGVAVGSVAGGIASLAITHIYFIKGKGLERLMGFLTSNIEKAMLPNIYTAHFNNRPKIHRKFFDQSPNNLGHPHLTEFILPTDRLIPGVEYTALFRVSDHDLDFHMAEHTQVTMLGEDLTVKNETFGFMSMSFSIRKTASKAVHNMDFKFTDSKGNGGRHVIEFYPLDPHDNKLQRITYGAR